MSENSNSNDDDVNDNRDALPKQKGEEALPSYSIEVCQGPDCTGLGGGVAVLEIEELVREYQYQNRDGKRIQVVAGGCRDFCSVGPNVHIHLRQPNKRGKSKAKSKSILLESFQNVKDPSSCDRVVTALIAHASSSENPVGADNANEPPPSSSMDRHRSMMARRAERKRWEALKDVSRTIAKCKKVVGSGGTAPNGGMERKLKIWKETCQDRIEGVPTSTLSGPSQERERRRMEHLVEIASEKLNRLCLQNDDDESDSSSYSSSSSDEESDEE